MESQKEYLKRISKYMKDCKFPKSLKSKIYGIAKEVTADNFRKPQSAVDDEAKEKLDIQQESNRRSMNKNM